MANSRRVYITLNSDKEKDSIIEEFLSNSYSEADLIKETLYRLATNGDNSQLLNTKNTNKVQKVATRTKKVKKDTKVKSDNKVLKVTNDTKELLNDDNSSMSNKEQIETDNIEKVQINDNDDNQVLKNNEFNQIMEFMSWNSDFKQWKQKECYITLSQIEGLYEALRVFLLKYISQQDDRI